jgi:hypothetical protein
MPGLFVQNRGHKATPRLVQICKSKTISRTVQKSRVAATPTLYPIASNPGQTPPPLPNA